MNDLFENIGRKMMSIATVLTVLMTIGGVILGILYMGFSPVLGFVVIIASPFVAYLSAMPLYGFGKLIESAERIEKKLYENPEMPSRQDSDELPDI